MHIAKSQSIILIHVRLIIIIYAPIITSFDFYVIAKKCRKFVFFQCDILVFIFCCYFSCTYKFYVNNNNLNVWLAKQNLYT